MNGPTCAAAECDRPTDTYLCARHEWDLVRTLKALPFLLTQLDVTRARADNIAPAGNKARRTTRTEDDVPCWCGCSTADPYHHVSHHGHHHSSATRKSDHRYARPELGSQGALPISEHAANVHAYATERLVYWCRDLVESRGVSLDVLPREDLTQGPFHLECAHGSCAMIREESTRPPLLQRLAHWLLAKVPSIRMDVGAGQLLWDMDDVRRRIRHVVDRPPDRVYAGPCACGLDLYTPLHFLTTPDATAVTCDGWNSDQATGCGATHTYHERRGYLLDGLESHSAPMGELLPVLCQFLPAPQPPWSVVSNWLKRGTVRVTVERPEGEPDWVSGGDLASALRRYRPMPQRATRASGKVAS